MTAIQLSSKARYTNFMKKIKIIRKGKHFPNLPFYRISYLRTHLTAVSKLDGGNLLWQSSFAAYKMQNLKLVAAEGFPTTSP
jgi:hypothetical protein